VHDVSKASSRKPLLLATRGRKIADDRFYERLGEKIQPMPNGCWAWKGDLDTRAGPFHFGVGSTPAYRVVWTILRGDIPEGWEIHHLCGNAGCCNPDHLEPMDPHDHDHEHVALRRSNKVA